MGNSRNIGPVAFVCQVAVSLEQSFFSAKSQYRRRAQRLMTHPERSNKSINHHRRK